MIDVRAVIERQMSETRLEILVFGPAIEPVSRDPYIAGLQRKRQDIKSRLVADGHSAAFGEDVVNPSLPAHLSDPLLQEIVAMGEADLILVLVGSPGTILEAQAIAGRRDLCSKTAFFCFAEHQNGLVVQHLQFVRTYGATCDLVTLQEVTDCHLTTTILAKVASIQTAKAFLY
jgi:hypothetical protein